MKKLPSVKALQTFEVTARHLSFSRAAEELCVSQSAVSHQIKTLEAAIGMPLFERKNNQVSLTTYGDALASVATDSFKRLYAAASNLREQNKTKLKVMAQSAIAIDWLAPRVSQFQHRHNNIEIMLSMAISGHDFEPADYDIIIGTWPVPTNFVTQKLRFEKWFPVCRPDVYEQIDVQDPVSLLHHTLLSSENGQDWQLWMQNHKIENTNKVQLQYFSNTILPARAALSGKGIALSSQFIVDDLVKHGRLVAIEKLWYELPWGHFSVHYRTNSQHQEMLAQFVDWLLKICHSNQSFTQ